MPVSDRSG